MKKLNHWCSNSNILFLFIAIFISIFLITGIAMAIQPENSGNTKKNPEYKKALDKFGKSRKQSIDQPNPKDLKLFNERLKLANDKIKKLRKAGFQADLIRQTTVAPKEVVKDKVLVILVEFAGTDTFTWDPATSKWDPLGVYDPAEDTGVEDDINTPAACANIITESTDFTYSGPLHNQIPVPATAAEDFDGESLVADFSNQYYYDLIFGNGVSIEYTRGDGSTVSEDFTGLSVADFYRDISGGYYEIEGEVIGWVQVNHSTWHYGADFCPGARSAGTSAIADGAIADAGQPRDLVKDALEAVKAANPDFNWAQYDTDGDGVIDRLWIIHAGVGEEEGTDMLDNTDYGEGAIWSHSSGLGADYEIVPGISANAYIIMPENSGIAVLAHEFGHNLGADDLYSYGDGNTSTGFWSTMSDSWTGYPIGFLPSTIDPWHLDGWGWLDPKLIVDPGKVYNVDLGQASRFPGGDNVYRAAKIALEDGESPYPVAPNGDNQWWGNEKNVGNAMMTMKTPIAITGAEPTLNFNLAYEIEADWDFLWIQASTDNGENWDTLTNENTVCTHDAGWIGGNNDFPDDLCAVNIGGFTGHNDNFPAYENQTFDLTAYNGQSILLRFWYMTDWGTVESGPFVDDIEINAGGSSLFSDNAESGDDNWDYSEDWQRVGVSKVFTHNYYLQWRNTNSDGGYDSTLGDTRWRYGAANTGLLVWYNNNLYPDNEVGDYMTNFPSFGPKGKMLVVDAHPEPYRDSYFIELGYNNEAANLHDTKDNERYNRGSMRDAPFSLNDSVGFDVHWPYVGSDTPSSFEGRPAVSLFDDSLGYYAGTELTKGIATSENEYWFTRQWDGSVVIPSKTAYPVKSDGYTAGEYLIYGATTTVDPEDDSNGWDYVGAAQLGDDGGTGNPSETEGAYGWKVKILSQSNQNARVAIWNSNATTPYTVEVVKTGTGTGTVSDTTDTPETSATIINCGESCLAMLNIGTEITLSATADKGSSFAGWTGDYEGTENPITITNVTEDMNIKANFLDEDGGGGGCFISSIFN